MNTSTASLDQDAFEGGNGCAYLIEDVGSHRMCGAPRRPVSSYCPQHHALCHLANGSAAEANRIREVEAIASAVGGRRSRRNSAGPSRQFLKRLEDTVSSS